MSRPGKRDLAGQVAVVTGASSGIGLSTAIALAQAGAHPVLVSRSETRLQRAALELARAAPSAGPAPVYACDVADPEAVRAMADRVVRDVGAPDILVANAGIGHWSAVVDLSLDRFREIIDVNLLGAVSCAKAFLPAMLARRRGTLAFVSSGFGECAFPYSAAYVASKHALNGFSGSLRAEVERHGLRVVLAMPGGTRTDFFEANAYPANMLSRYLFQRLAEPDRVGRQIVRAIARGRRRVVTGRLNDLGLRLIGALPEIEAAFLSLVGRRIAKHEEGRSERGHRRDVRPGTPGRSA